MRYFVGIDIGTERKKGAIACVYAVQRPDGTLQKLLRFYYGQEAINKALLNLASNPDAEVHVVVEYTGEYSTPFFLIQHPRIHLYAVDTFALRRLRGTRAVKRKTDPEDARELAKLFTEHALLKDITGGVAIYFQPIDPEQFIPYKVARRLLSDYLRTTALINRYINRLHMFLYLEYNGRYMEILGINNGKKKISEHHLTPERLRIIESIVENPRHPINQETIPIYLSDIRLLSELVERKRWIEERAGSILLQHPDYPLLSHVSGFGKAFLIKFIFTYWDIRRFPNSNAFKWYLGLITRLKDVSGESSRNHKRKRKMKHVKTAFYQVATNSRTDERIRNIWWYYIVRTSGAKTVAEEEGKDPKTVFRRLRREGKLRDGWRAKALVKFSNLMAAHIYRALKNRERFDPDRLPPLKP